LKLHREKKDVLEKEEFKNKFNMLIILSK